MTSVIEQKTRGQVRFLRLPEVLARTGLSRSTIYVRLEQGRFPRPVSLGSRAVGWVEAEVDEWMRERIAASRGEALVDGLDASHGISSTVASARTMKLRGVET